SAPSVFRLRLVDGPPVARSISSAILRRMSVRSPTPHFDGSAFEVPALVPAEASPAVVVGWAPHTYRSPRAACSSCPMVVKVPSSLASLVISTRSSSSHSSVLPYRYLSPPPGMVAMKALCISSNFIAICLACWSLMISPISEALEVLNKNLLLHIFRMSCMDLPEPNQEFVVRCVARISSMPYERALEP